MTSPAQVPLLDSQLQELRRLYPGATTALDFTSPFELLVATVLAAQCTDVRVNQVTPELFRRYPDARSLQNASLEDLESLIGSVTFFRAKSRNLSLLAARLVADHEGEVPADLDALVSLPGVGRKTAQVVLAYSFGVPGVVVDTHCKRLAVRLGWTAETDPVKVEMDLRELLDEQNWIDVPQYLVYHGRAVCLARKPRCSSCTLVAACPSASV